MRWEREWDVKGKREKGNDTKWTERENGLEKGRWESGRKRVKKKKLKWKRK